MELPVHSLPRKAYRSDLSDAQWKRIKRFLPKPKRFGRPCGNDREVINGILYVLNTGCRWEDMPHDIDASYQTCHRRLLEYQRRRVSVPKTSSPCIFRSLEPSVRTLTPLKWRSVLTVKPNVINRLLKTRSIMQERQGAEREVQCLLKIGILARDSQRQRGNQREARLFEQHSRAVE